jgi:acylglycerol lipase
MRIYDNIRVYSTFAKRHIFARPKNTQYPFQSKIQSVVLIAPMAKISDEMLPNPVAIKFLQWMLGNQGAERLIGLLPLAPSKDLSSLAYRLEHKRQLAYCNPINYSRKPRLTTARELVLTTQRISSSLKNFDAPFLVLHGLEDSSNGC